MTPRQTIGEQVGRLTAELTAELSGPPNGRATGTASPTWRGWLPDLAVAVGVAFLGFVEVLSAYPVGADVVLLFGGVMIAAAAAGLFRRAPKAALGLVWTLGFLQVIAGMPILFVQVSAALVAFGAARWGSRATLWFSGVSIPLGSVIVASLIAVGRLGGRRFGGASFGLTGTETVVVLVVVLAILGVPWLVGLALRNADRAKTSKASQAAAEASAALAQHESEQSREIARLREEQARLARDVHDVVGHSLAVILAQAESGQYLPEGDTAAHKRTLATIATSARASLKDVRAVLTAAQQPPTARAGGLDSLIEGVRSSGHEVIATEVGVPRPLPPEIDVVAFRVLQEMLTNAIRHGRRDRPVLVERHWPDDGWGDDLRIEVGNVEEPHAEEAGAAEPGAADLRSRPAAETLTTQPLTTQPLSEPITQPSTEPVTEAEAEQQQEHGGRGIDGMRRRLESVGGRLDVRRRDEADGVTFTATAWVPVRDGGR